LWSSVLPVTKNGHQTCTLQLPRGEIVHITHADLTPSLLILLLQVWSQESLPRLKTTQASFQPYHLHGGSAMGFNNNFVFPSLLMMLALVPKRRVSSALPQFSTSCAPKGLWRKQAERAGGGDSWAPSWSLAGTSQQFVMVNRRGRKTTFPREERA
jgi:hypothetical protein